MRDQIRKKLKNTPLCFSFFNDDNFEAMVKLAHDYGATHIEIKALPFQYNTFLPDNSDPYPNWSQSSIGIFRLCPPKKVAEFIPNDIVKENKKYIEKKILILRKYGLKACLSGCEPLWLPEQVYRKHPHWRGVQCELGRIASKPYFAPAIDEKEVCELYQESIRDICQCWPEFDLFTFWTNDCGSGISWSSYSYPGPNGPSKHRLRNPGERIGGWLKSLKKGVEDAGSTALVNVSSFSFPPGELASVKAELGASLYFNGVNANDKRIIGVSASLTNTIDSNTCSVKGIAPPKNFAENYYDIINSDDNTLKYIRLDNSHIEIACEIMKNIILDSSETSRSVTVAKALYTSAVNIFSEEAAESIIKAWDLTDKVFHAIDQIRQKGLGNNFALCLTTARWLHRPLVLHPELLNSSEKSYYENYLFTKASDQPDNNLCFILGKHIFIGDGIVWSVRWGLQEAIDSLGRICTDIAKETTVAKSMAVKEKLQLYHDCYFVLRCFLETAKNVIMYQHALSTTNHIRYSANPLDYDDNIQYDQRALQLRRIARAEVDNCTELANILANNASNILYLAHSIEKQNVFLYGSNIVNGINNKINVMLDHWQEYEEAYPTSKEYEYEPPQLQEYGKAEQEIKQNLTNVCRQRANSCMKIQD